MNGGAAAGAAGGAAAAAAAIANAIKASGAIIKVEPAEFRKILDRCEKPLVVIATGGVFSKHYRYLTSYKGLYFFTKSKETLHLPGDVETVPADTIWIPG